MTFKEFRTDFDGKVAGKGLDRRIMGNPAFRRLLFDALEHVENVAGNFNKKSSDLNVSDYVNPDITSNQNGFSISFDGISFAFSVGNNGNSLEFFEIGKTETYRGADDKDSMSRSILQERFTMSDDGELIVNSAGVQQSGHVGDNAIDGSSISLSEDKYDSYGVHFFKKSKLIVSEGNIHDSPRSSVKNSFNTADLAWRWNGRESIMERVGFDTAEVTIRDKNNENKFHSFLLLNTEHGLCDMSINLPDYPDSVSINPLTASEVSQKIESFYKPDSKTAEGLRQYTNSEGGRSAYYSSEDRSFISPNQAVSGRSK